MKCIDRVTVFTINNPFNSRLYCTMKKSVLVLYLLYIDATLYVQCLDMYVCVLGGHAHYCYDSLLWPTTSLSQSSDFSNILFWSRYNIIVRDADKMIMPTWFKRAVLFIIQRHTIPYHTIPYHTILCRPFLRGHQARTLDTMISWKLITCLWAWLDELTKSKAKTRCSICK